MNVAISDKSGPLPLPAILDTTRLRGANKSALRVHIMPRRDIPGFTSKYGGQIYVWEIRRTCDAIVSKFVCNFCPITRRNCVNYKLPVSTASCCVSTLATRRHTFKSRFLLLNPCLSRSRSTDRIEERSNRHSHDERKCFSPVLCAQQQTTSITIIIMNSTAITIPIMAALDTRGPW